MKTIKIVLELSATNTLSEKNAVWLVNEHFHRFKLKDYYVAGVSVKTSHKINFKRVISFEKACTAEIIRRNKEEKLHLKKLFGKIVNKVENKYG